MTINIIKKWEEIGNNYLDSNLEYTKDASQKLSLAQAFQKTIELLPSDIQDLTGILQALYEIKRRVKFPGASFPVLTALNNLFKEIATKLVNKYSYRELKKCLVPSTSQKDSYSSLFSKIREENYKHLFNSKNNKGIIYKIENQKGCTSYLIGTIHRSGKLLDNTKIPEVVKNSSEFFSEIGKLVLEISTQEDIVDAVLTKIAIANNIPVHALETPEELLDIDNRATKEYSLLTKDYIEKKKELKLKKLTEREELEKYNEYSSDETLAELDVLAIWKKGDVASFKSISKICSSLSILDAKLEVSKQSAKHRNNHWLMNTSLLTKLENTEEPISIAVGAGHLFGRTGLIRAFEDKGLKIEQI